MEIELVYVTCFNSMFRRDSAGPEIGSSANIKLGVKLRILTIPVKRAVRPIVKAIQLKTAQKSFNRALYTRNDMPIARFVKA